jgi:hypothetical protein
MPWPPTRGALPWPQSHKRKLPCPALNLKSHHWGTLFLAHNAKTADIPLYFLSLSGFGEWKDSEGEALNRGGLEDRGAEEFSGAQRHIPSFIGDYSTMTDRTSEV